MDNKEQAKDFEKVEGAQLSDEEQQQVQGAFEKLTVAEADMAMEQRKQAAVKATTGLIFE